MELAIKQLSDNLRFLQQSKADQKRIALLFNILKDIKEYYFASKFLEEEHLQLVKEFNDYKQNAESTKIKLEGICLYHGITNIEWLMGKTESAIIAEVKDHYKDKAYQIPLAIKKILNER